MSNLTDFIGGSLGYKVVPKSSVDYTKEVQLLSDTVVKESLCKIATFSRYGINGAEAGPWRQKTSGTTATGNQSAVHYNDGTDDIMVVFGGMDNGNNYLKDTWEYNITKDSWTQKTSGATARITQTAVHYNDGTDDIMVVFGGYDGNNVLKDTWEYNITKDSWTQKTSSSAVRRNHSAVHYNNGTDDIMVVFGGYDGSYYLNDTWEYNITKDSWTQKTSGATARSYMPTVHYNDGTDDIMVVFGGHGDNGYLHDAWAYNITKDSWTQKTSGPAGMTLFAGSPTAIHYNDGTDDIMIAFCDGPILAYNITKDTWTQKTSGPGGAASVVHYKDGTDDIMIVFCGSTWEYNIPVDNYSLDNTIISPMKS